MSKSKKNPEADFYYPAGEYKYEEKDAGGLSNAKVATDKIDLSDPELAKARDGSFLWIIMIKAIAMV